MVNIQRVIQEKQGVQVFAGNCRQLLVEYAKHSLSDLLRQVQADIRPIVATCADP